MKPEREHPHAAEDGRTELDWPRHAGVIDDVLAGLAERDRARRKRRRRAVAAMGVLALVLAAGSVWRVHQAGSMSGKSLLASGYIQVLEPRTQVLPDGSTVELREGAEITVDFDEKVRRVTLVSGTAYFEVKKNPGRPFIVQASGLAVRAVGTAFSVELTAETMAVLVTEGRVSVNPLAAANAPAGGVGAAALAIVDVGRSVLLPVASAAAPAVAELSRKEFGERLAWRIPRLEFSGTPLGELIATFNRHNREQFVIEDESLARLRLSGLLRADKIDALVQLLESDFPIKAERRDGTIVLHRAR